MTVMKTFQQFMEDQSKNPFIDQKTGKQNVGPFDYGHNPPIPVSYTHLTLPTTYGV